MGLRFVPMTRLTAELQDICGTVRGGICAICERSHGCYWCRAVDTIGEYVGGHNVEGGIACESVFSMLPRR